MRYINLDELVTPVGWDGRAATAAAAIAGGAPIDNYDRVWRELKNGLGELLYDKCWYCETPIPRSDNAVDHFRPKGRCADAAQPHTGYHWLAFAKDNYRYSCTFCNSRRRDVTGGTVGGKADRFPLMDETVRTYQPGSHYHESPMLLDPCDLDDWELLGCRRENGSPCASTVDPVIQSRVDASIAIYHLDHEPTCKLRHPIAVRLIGDVEQAKRFFILAKNNNPMKQEFVNLMRKIKLAVHRKSPYSGEMLFLLKGQRELEHPWIQKLIDA